MHASGIAFGSSPATEIAVSAVSNNRAATVRGRKAHCSLSVSAPIAYGALIPTSASRLPAHLVEKFLRLLCCLCHGILLDNLMEGVDVFPFQSHRLLTYSI